MSRKKYAIPLVIAASTLLLMACDNGGGEVDPVTPETRTVVTEATMDGSYALYTAGGAATSFDAIDEVHKDTAAKGSTGVFDRTGMTFDQKTEALGALEKYAIDNTLTGIPLYQTDGYMMYNSRITKGTNNYVVGYGFDIMRTGSINEAVSVGQDDYPTYYHTWNANNPNSLAYWDDSGSEVASLNGYVSSSYFGTRLNEAKTGYEWYGVLSAEDRPYGVFTEGTGATATTTVKKASELDLDELTNTWRVYVRTGEKGGVAYRTASTREDRAAYNGKYATLDDYVSAFKILLNGKYAYYRGNEIAGSTGSSAIAGASAYYNATAELDPWDAEAKEAWEDVGVKSGSDDTGDYIQITLGAAVNRFYGMYYITSTFYQPVPMDFFKLVTNDGEQFDNWGKYNSDRSTTIIDNILCVGPMYLEKWADTEIVYAVNRDWWEIKEDSSLYSIDGVYIDILTAYNTDNTAAFTEFLAGNLDAAGIPQTYISQYRNDSRTVQVPGDSVFKLNVNSCDQDLWNELFGDNGSVSQQGDDAYKCKPWMANDNFVKALFYSIDRKTFAESRGYAPAIDYFSDDYLSNPEEGTSYNSTEAHANALKGFWGDTVNTNGYSLQAAGNLFTTAISELMAAGDVKSGATITIDAWWMYQSQSAQAEEIASYMEKAFNASEGAVDNKITLDVVNNYVSVWSDVYYAHLLIGKFDLGFGSISGNSLDPLNFMEVLKSDNSSGFTLNWGADTSVVGLEFDNQWWSFDTLWAACDHGVATYKGMSVPPFVLSFKEKHDGTGDDAGDVTFDFTYEDAISHFVDLGETEFAKTLSANYYIMPMYVFVMDNYSFEDDYMGPFMAYYASLLGSSATLGDTADVVEDFDGDDVVMATDDPVGSIFSNAVIDADAAGYRGSFSITFEAEQILASAQAHVDAGSTSPFLSVYLYGVGGLDTSTCYIDMDFNIQIKTQEVEVSAE